jgi:uncharacterized protein (TIGR00730 family)
VTAHEDTQFLKRDDVRPVRLQLELLKPELVQNEQQIHSTIVVFGSARVPDPQEGVGKLARLERIVALHPHRRRERERLIILRRLMANVKYYEEARRFGRLVSSRYQRPGKREFVIVTGGGPGIMEVANRGAHDVKQKSIGLNITLPFEQTPNPYISPELCFQFRYFAIRKMHFLLRAKALAVFPGGFGTFDEMFEALTLIQTRKMVQIPIVLFGRAYWEKALNLQFLVEQGMIDPQDLKLIQFVETAEEAWDVIQRFYRDRRRLERKKLFR